MILKEFQRNKEECVGAVGAVAVGAVAVGGEGMTAVVGEENIDLAVEVKETDTDEDSDVKVKRKKIGRGRGVTWWRWWLLTGV